MGATLHIEPDDVPRAGEPSLAWFALTRRGGDIVPLAACDCDLTVYALPSNDVVAQPILEAVSAEGYDSLPGTFITFPQIGAYEIVLEGQPTTPGDFAPFEFQFEVTVATGTATASLPNESLDAVQEDGVREGRSPTALTGDREHSDNPSVAEPMVEPPADARLPSTAPAPFPGVSLLMVIMGGVVVLGAIALIRLRGTRETHDHSHNGESDLR
jgi:hypothetical protein